MLNPTPFNTTEKAPPEPHNTQAEQIFLGACLQNNSIITATGDKITAEMFYNSLHQRIYEQMVKNINQGIAANVVSLKIFFDNDVELQGHGGIEYLNKIFHMSLVVFDISNMARIIYDTYLRRRLIEFYRIGLSKAYDYDADNTADSQAQEAAQQLWSLIVTNKSTGLIHNSTFAAEVFFEIEQHYKNKNTKSDVLYSKFTDLDKILCGLKFGELIILAGRPSMGKTALMLNMMVNVTKQFEEFADDKNSNGDGNNENGSGKNSNNAVALFSLEMTANELEKRLFLMDENISARVFLYKNVREQDFEAATKKAAELANMQIFIDDYSYATISYIEAQLKKLSLKKNVRVVFIDYLQLIGKDGSKATYSKSSDKVHEIGEITRKLKAIAKEMGICVVLLSQLSRMTENRESKRPQLSDLRDSGNIEQDADSVVLIFRQDYYLMRNRPAEGTVAYVKWQENVEKQQNIVELIVAKNRNGPIGEAKICARTPHLFLNF